MAEPPWQDRCFPRGPSLTLFFSCGLLLSLLFAAGRSAAAPAGVQVTPDGKRTLVSKDVGGERWAITRENDIGVVTGNVFFPGGSEPAFLWCAQLDSDATGFHLSCSGADRCPLAPCPSEEWVFLADLTLSESFFQPRADDPATYLGPLSLAGIASAGDGPPSGLQETPAVERTLVSKDVGGERWAITFDPDDGSVTGNVFFPGGGEPRFVFCEASGQQGPNLAFTCSGADRCTSSPCSPSEWAFIADVLLPATFFAAPIGVDLEAVTAAARAALGETAAFEAMVLALDRGYSLRQVLRAVLTRRLQASGEIRLKVGLIEEPAGEPLGEFEVTAPVDRLAHVAATAAELCEIFKDKLGPGSDKLATLTRLLDRGYTIPQIKRLLDDASVVDCTAIASAEEFRRCAEHYGDILVLTDRLDATITPGKDPEETLSKTPQTPCGNGRVESGEQCDGGDLDLQTCQSLGYLGGALRCNERCVFDRLGCRSVVKCGDGAVDRSERCDGADLGGNSCASLGYLGGALRCTSQCDFDTSLCRKTAVCGDGVAEQDERCDGTHFRGESCQRLGDLGGTLRCTDDCQLDARDCSSQQVCGNGIGERGEQCDGADFRGDTCERLGFLGGSLRCTPTCDLDASGCRRRAGCGDGVAEESEACDGSDLRGQTCTSLPSDFIGGTLRCTQTCDLDASGCRRRETCGDGIAEGGEDCDRFDFRGKTCRDLDFPDGSLVCTADCQIDSRSCQREQRCGDGFAEGSEQCDDQDLNGQSCIGLGFEDGGSLRCGGDCRYDTSGCHDVVCGNNAIEGSEECDGSNLGGRSCQQLGFASGQLRCGANCRYDTSQCCDGVSCGGECFAAGTVCCGGGNACPAGNACIPNGGGCCPPEAQICPGGGCFPDSAVCCPNGTACSAGTVCVTGGCCPQSFPFLCPDGHTCSTGPGACP
jgi:hypothetical protein